MQIVFIVIASILIVAGGVVGYGSKHWIKKYNMMEKIKPPYEDQMTEEEVENYKKMKANLNFKIVGLGMVFVGAMLMYIFLR